MNSSFAASATLVASVTGLTLSSESGGGGSPPSISLSIIRAAAPMLFGGTSKTLVSAVLDLQRLDPFGAEREVVPLDLQPPRRRAPPRSRPRPPLGRTPRSRPRLSPLRRSARLLWRSSSPGAGPRPSAPKASSASRGRLPAVSCQGPGEPRRDGKPSSASSTAFLRRGPNSALPNLRCSSSTPPTSPGTTTLVRAEHGHLVEPLGAQRLDSGPGRRPAAAVQAADLPALALVEEGEEVAAQAVEVR